MSTSRVMVATSFGPGREWCIPLVERALRGLGRVAELAVVWDGLEARPLATGLPTRAAPLPAWRGGVDRHRFGRLARMRQVSRALFLSSGCDYLYWHDCDMLPPAGIVEALLALDVPVATGCYPYRGLDHAMQPILHCRAEDVTAELQRCEGYGMGCMLVRRDALAQTGFRLPAYWRDVEPEGVGEDWQWGLDSGVETVVDTQLSCWHCGEDGEASRIVFGDLDYVAVWMGEGVVVNAFGEWKHAGVRADLTPEEAATLPPGFAHGWARQMHLEWAEWRELVC